MSSSIKTTSLRALFLRRMLWVLLPSLLIGSALSYFYAARNILESYDLNLLDDATDLVHQVQIQTSGHLMLDLPLAAHQMLITNNDDAVIYAVWDREQTLLSGTNELHLEMNHEKLIDRYSFKNISIKGKTYRVILLQARLGNQPFFVAVAQTTHGIDHLLNNVLAGFLLLGSLLIIVACIGVTLGVKRSLVPIEALRNAIANRAPENLQPISENDAPSELKPIIHGVNELLTNLEKSVLNHRRFVADAAHQLRTPLAILRSKLELSLVNPPEDNITLFRELLTTTERASHLTSQLLSLSRIENAEIILPEFESVDLTQLLRDAAAHFVMAAEKNNIELEFNLIGCYIKGNSLLLQELFNNLFDNAIKYAGPRATVKVDMYKSSQYVHIIISDNGIGVPNDLLNNLGQPFFRCQPQVGDGCGLGLAIAKEIVVVHDGDIQFERTRNSSGLCVTLKFSVA